MDVLKLILSLIYLIACVVLVIVVLIQDSKSQGMSVITGEQDTFFSSKKSKGKEAMLTNLTIILGIFFAVVALVLGAIFSFVS